MDERDSREPQTGDQADTPPTFPPASTQPQPPAAAPASSQESTHAFGFGWERPQGQQPQQQHETQVNELQQHAPQQHQPTAAYPAWATQPHQPIGAPATQHQAQQHAAYPAPTPIPGSTTAAPPRRRRQWPGIVTAAVLAAVLASGGTALATGALDQDGTSSAYSGLGSTTPVAASSASDVEWQALASQVRDSVVAITVTTAQGVAQGSGVVIDANEGYVVTNNHVVGDASNGGITVTLADGRIIDATIVGTDPTTDIAVVKLSDVPGDLQSAPWGDSTDVLVGQDVMAVGNPLGLASTVTTGIVSAIDRPVSTSAEDASSAVVTNAIQIDAAINPGNSGGPLFDTDGEIIGINSSIATTSEASGSIGLGFAIPSAQAKRVAEQLIADGVADHAYLGVTLSDATATADGVTRSGAQVESVSSGTPAAEAGLRAGDVVVGIDAKAVGGAESLTGFVRQYAAGDEVTLTVVRGGEALDVNVTLADRPVEDTAATPQQQQSPDSGSNQLPQLPGLPGLPGSGQDNG